MIWLIISGLVIILSGFIYKYVNKPEESTIEEYNPKKYTYMMSKRRW